MNIEPACLILHSKRIEHTVPSEPSIHAVHTIFDEHRSCPHPRRDGDRRPASSTATSTSTSGVASSSSASSASTAAPTRYWDLDPEQVRCSFVLSIFRLFFLGPLDDVPSFTEFFFFFCSPLEFHRRVNRNRFSSSVYLVLPSFFSIFCLFRATE